ncbi:cell wall-binding repeat-containing protein [Halobacillus rhizosphaerae]|uniref:cell wall-binding repeat-containing protein n=1 Tax=Halobacillus rhizosphaerae TaxID=3064889 RepID=UPI00398BBBCD
MRDMKMTSKKIIPLFLVTLFIVCMMSYSHAEAASKENHYSFTNGERTVKLTNQIEVKVNNKEKASVIVTRNGEKVYSNEEFAKLSDLYIINKDNQQYLAVAYRMDGSGQALFFRILSIKSDQVDEIYQSSTYSRAKLSIENSKVQVEVPTYEQGDNKSEPSSISSLEFTINGDKVKLKQETKTPVKNAITTQSSGGSTQVNERYTNPSYQEISRILTEEAEKADIPAEVLKAIAFQESGWQQYWSKGNTPVNWYSDQCGNWDGTNVKLGYDCIGIGIMQVSDYRYLTEGQSKNKYVKRLKEDIRFNIEEGIKILESKWNYYDVRSKKYSNGYPYIPTINNNDRDIIENWYFAVMAYNGLSDRNNPITNAYSPMAYQEDIFKNIRDYSLVDVTPFPTHKLFTQDSILLNFGLENVKMNGPLHKSKDTFTAGETAYASVNDLNLRSSPGGNKLMKLNAGDKVTITGDFKANSSNTSHFVWYPVQASNGTRGYVAGSYLNQTDDVTSYELSGDRRYETSASLANFGWHWNQPEAVVIGRGDLPIDSLTGSVLASEFSSPLLLTETDQLPTEVSHELSRLSPKKVYLLGGETGAVSKSVEQEVHDLLPASDIKRLAGETRYKTSYAIASEVADHASVDQIFVTTGDENSPDALSIAPYAGEKNIPILFTESNHLSQSVKDFIKENSISSATIIGGTTPVSNQVKSELEQLTGKVTRVYGTDRYKTSIAIAQKYYDQSKMDKVLFTRGDETVDALSASSLAADYQSPILLTRTDGIPKVTEGYLNKAVLQPELYYIGGENAISNKTRNQIETYLKR